MPLLIIFLIWYQCYGKSNPETYRKVSSVFPKILVGLVLFSAFSTLFIPLLVPLIFVLALLGVTAPFWIFIWIIKRLTGKNGKGDRKKDYAYYQNSYVQNNNRQSIYNTVTGLTRSVPKRKKIVSKFNTKYDLNLTEDEINRIVDASYMSNCWEREIYDMSLHYDSLAQWYKTDSGWLRAYLHAFPVQNVSSDFEMQHKICVDSFDQIFKEIDPGSFQNVDACVEAINERYLTNFDEVTFMVAYRFLQANDIRYNLPHMQVIKATSEIDELKKKYDESSSTSSSKEKMRLR